MDPLWKMYFRLTRPMVERVDGLQRGVIMTRLNHKLSLESHRLSPVSGSLLITPQHAHTGFQFSPHDSRYDQQLISSCGSRQRSQKIHRTWP